MNPINRSINTMAPNNFPLIERDGKKHFTLIRNEDGDTAYQEFINDILRTRGRFMDDGEYYERHHIIPRCWFRMNRMNICLNVPFPPINLFCFSKLKATVFGF